MSIWKRLKNLWIISSYEVTKPNETYEAGTTIASLFKSKKAQIVDMRNPIEDIRLD